MKKITFIFISCIALSTTSFAQKKTDSLPAYTDSTAIISVKDLEPLYKEIRKGLSYDQAEPFVKWLELLVATKVAAYEENRKKK
jgi:hypothetical protein